MTVEKTPKRKTDASKDKTDSSKDKTAAPKDKIAAPKAKSATSRAKAVAQPSVVSNKPIDLSALELRNLPVDRRQLIAQEAYLRAERRGFAPGYEVEDWLAAERSLEASDLTGV